ncbi:DUF2339 domain-containing protein [Undibacterium sp. Di26W]|uniref:DUF2339 domain-containing protein n=1 Tax=Undibacterium sp. Di26W TaxID=3413035 RepID=UPI003BF25AD1
MWFVGGIIGFIIGVATGSGPVMLLFAVLGGFVGQMLGSSRKKNPKPWSASEAAQAKPGQSKPEDPLAEMRRKMAAMENRLQNLEHELASLKAGTASSGADAAAATSVLPEQASGIAAAAVRPSDTGMATAEPVITTPPPLPLPIADEALSIDDGLTFEPAPAMAATITGKDANASLPVRDEAAFKPVELTPAMSAPVPPVASPAMPTSASPVVSPAVTTVIPAVTPVPPAPVKPAAAKRPPPPPPKSLRESLPAPIANLIFGGNTLVKAGVLILFLGLAFLLRYTAERVTVPVELRYAGVALVGVVLLSLGWLLRNKRRDYALILQGMAIGVFYLTTLSAMKMHGLVTPEVGFGFMFAVSVLSAALAVLQNAPMLAIVAALEGFVTPVLTSTGENRPMGLFTYLAVLDIGIFLVAWFNAWRILNLIGFVGTFTLALGWADKFYTDSQYGLVQPFLLFFFVLFALIGLLFARRTLKETENQEGPLATLKRVGRVDSALVFGNPVTAFGMQYMLVKHTEYGAAFSALAVGFFYLLLARFVFSRQKQGLALLAEAYVIVAAIFGTLAIPLGLEGTWTGAAWAVEGAGMYWLGWRQQRPYARAFAYVVLVGASYKLLNGIYLNPDLTGPLWQGPWLGPVLLAVSVFVVWNLHRRADSKTVSSWEEVPNRFLPWLGVAAIALLPWMLLVPQYAAAALAVLALLVSAVARRFGLQVFAPVAAALQATALVTFLFTLHAATAANGAAGANSANSTAALADGWHGMLAALIIAASILFTAGRAMRETKQKVQEQGRPPAWSYVNNLAVVSGCALLHLAMLFAIDLQQAALIWPLTSCLLLWAGLRMSHTALAGLAAALQVISAVLYGVEIDHYHGRAFAHLGFLIPLSLAIAAWFSADRVRAEAARMRQVLLELGNTGNTGNAARPLASVWLNPWCNGKLATVLPIVWGLGWWLSAWFPESLDVLEHNAQTVYAATVAVTISILSSVLMIALAKWRRWPAMGGAAIVFLPLLIFSALIGVSGSQTDYLPSAHFGWLLWSLALAWHVRALKWQQVWLASWPRLLSLTHIVGFWFFLLLAAREGQLRFEPLADTWSSWPLLGWVLVPVLVFWFIGSRVLAIIWPLNTYRRAYLELACAPVALYLLGWCWLTNTVSAGDASPLPYLPLLNPLELGQWLVLLALLHWWRALPSAAVKTDGLQVSKVLAAATALALLTGMVLRSCHHFAGVPWDADALFASRLSQAAVSITWAVCGVAVMLFGNRRMSRGIWIAGATLLGVVVVKLFLIELADRGGLYRIVSFIGVGILLLVVGYFAPVPVKPKAVGPEPEDDTESRQEHT